MGFFICRTEAELMKAFESVRGRGETLFKNAGVFLEKYVESGKHIEVQVID